MHLFETADPLYPFQTPLIIEIGPTNVKDTPPNINTLRQTPPLSNPTRQT
jgi:hypothetical protein